MALRFTPHRPGLSTPLARVADLLVAQAEAFQRAAAELDRDAESWRANADAQTSLHAETVADELVLEAIRLRRVGRSFATRGARLRQNVNAYLRHA